VADNNDDMMKRIIQIGIGLVIGYIVAKVFIGIGLIIWEVNRV